MKGAKTDARSLITTYAYNSVHRPTSQTYSDSTPAVYIPVRFGQSPQPDDGWPGIGQLSIRRQGPIDAGTAHADRNQRDLHDILRLQLQGRLDADDLPERARGPVQLRHRRRMLQLAPGLGCGPDDHDDPGFESGL